MAINTKVKADLFKLPHDKRFYDFNFLMVHSHDCEGVTQIKIVCRNNFILE